MKTFLKYAAALSLALLLAAAFSACKKITPDVTPEDPPVVTPEDPPAPAKPEKGKVVISIPTESLYDPFGITAVMSAMLEAGDCTVSDSVLVYNAEGALATKVGIQTGPLGKRVLETEELPNGSYTLLLWQAGGRADGDKPWEIRDEASLSTVYLYQKGCPVSVTYILGYASASVTIDGDAPEVEMAPQALGCVIAAVVENLPEDGTYSRVAVVSESAQNWYRGYYLDPGRTEENHWLISEKYIEVPVRVNAGEGINVLYSLMHGDDLTLYVRGDYADGSHDIIGSCQHRKAAAGEKYVFHMDMDRRTWQPPFFGTPQEYAAWKADRDQGLLPFYPNVNWGCSLADIEAFVQARPWWRIDNEELRVSSGGSRWFRNYFVSDTLYESYLFGTQDGQDLQYVICGCLEPTLPIEMAFALVEHQGYVYAGKLQYPSRPRAYDVFFSEDQQTEVYIRPKDSGLWDICYTPTDPDDLQYITYL